MCVSTVRAFHLFRYSAEYIQSNDSLNNRIKQQRINDMSRVYGCYIYGMILKFGGVYSLYDTQITERCSTLVLIHSE